MDDNIASYGRTSAYSSYEGRETELIKIGGARLYVVVDGEESVLLQSGGFVLKLTKQGGSSLATVDAEVADVHWPATKDSPVWKVRERWYTFSVPGVFYALIFSEAASLEDLQELESLLLKYSLFHVRLNVSIAGLEAAYKRDCGKDQLDCMGGDCSRVADSELITSMSLESASRVPKESSISTGVMEDMITGSRDQCWPTSNNIHENASSHMKRMRGGSGSAGAHLGIRTHQIMKAHVQRARRLSAVTKLISKALLRGAIRSSDHVDRSTQISSPSTGSEASQGWGEMDGVALSSVDAVSKVVDAVELCGRSVNKSTGRGGGGSTDHHHHADLLQHRSSYGNEAVPAMARSDQGIAALAGKAMDTLWTLNKVGVVMLLKATAASTVMINLAQPKLHAAIGSSSSLHANMLPPSSNQFHKTADEIKLSAFYPIKTATQVKHSKKEGDQGICISKRAA